MKIEALKKRLASLKFEPAWIDNNDDCFLSSIDALPGEDYLAALRRQATLIWSCVD
jgi:hypothetical protein